MRQRRDEVIKKLRLHEAELRSLGVARLSLFGSVARGDDTEDSDVDLAIEMDRVAERTAFDYFTISDRLKELLGGEVDVLSEPARRERMQRELDRDRVSVF